MEELPSITALAFRDSLNMAVGTATGQVTMGMLLLYFIIIYQQYKYSLFILQPYGLLDKITSL